MPSPFPAPPALTIRMSLVFVTCLLSGIIASKSPTSTVDAVDAVESTPMGPTAITVGGRSGLLPLRPFDLARGPLSPGPDRRPLTAALGPTLAQATTAEWAPSTNRRRPPVPPTTPRAGQPPWTEPAWGEAWNRPSTTTPPAPAPAAATPAATTTTVPAPATTVARPATGATHDVRTFDDWTRAVAAARPGDVIRLVADIGRPLQYRGPRSPGDGAKAADGTPGLPITITAAESVWIDPGDLHNVTGALDVMGAAHIHVVGVRVRNSQFGIRILDSTGSPEAPLRVANNQVVDIGHAGIHVAGDLTTHHPSRFIRVEGNTITRTGRIAPEFGEGIYLGYGTQEWADHSSDLQVLNNRISATTAEGVDVKPGTRNVVVAGNLIHDVSPLRGGAISAHYVGTAPNPDPGTPGNVVIRRNRIWNVNLDNRGGSNDWAIWVGHGGVTIEGNTIWGMRNDASATRAVRIRGLHDFGPHPIRIVENVFWTASGWVAEGSPSGAGIIQAQGNRGPAGAVGIEAVLQPGGAVPPLGSGGTADSGGGPGSALGVG